ncbi:MAG: DUF2384 domain-containing protein [Parvibaculum sp.]|nr:DUF2384 domain-containing protein [Parvibaculum sp.]
MANPTESVSEILGLAPKGKPLAPMEFVQRVEKGLPLKSLQRITFCISPENQSFSYFIVQKATLSRRKTSKDKRLSVGESEKVARLARIWSDAVRVWRSEDDARRFLNEPHMLLDGRVPAEMAAKTEEGARLVEGILGRLQHGSAL